jgi:hypothetical protein
VSLPNLGRPVPFRIRTQFRLISDQPLQRTSVYCQAGDRVVPERRSARPSAFPGLCTGSKTRDCRMGSSMRVLPYRQNRSCPRRRFRSRAAQDQNFRNCVCKSVQRRKVYLIKANDLNTQHLAFASTVNIASGDISETCGDHALPRNQQTNWLLQVHSKSCQRC